MGIHFTSFCSRFLENLLEKIEVTQTQYDHAIRAYTSVGNWLDRDGSTLANRSPQVYVQGSFRLGTAIKPNSADGDLDLDLVCELLGSKYIDTQESIKNLVGKELALYAEARGVVLDPPGNRCWTLKYADQTKFHMDILPAVPDEGSRRMLLEQSNLDFERSDTALSITDERHTQFRNISLDWPHSNPKGFADWFAECGGEVFDKQRRDYFESSGHQIFESIEDVPIYRLKTPLQGAIQLLKRHRDVMFEGRLDEKPISIIIATLAAKSYNQENTLADALFGVLFSMDRHIEDRDGIAWVPNPTDALENFADKWQVNSRLEECFYEWLDKARDDFEVIAAASSAASFPQTLQESFGSGFSSAKQDTSSPVVETAITLTNVPFTTRPMPAIVQSAEHKQQPIWPAHRTISGKVSIVSAKAGKSMWRRVKYRSGDKPLPKKVTLWFRAKTNVPKPYQVYWRTLNTGDEALRNGGLRGDINTEQTEEGGLIRKEHTLWSGEHSVECFIVKDECLVARSGEFIVNIE